MGFVQYIIVVSLQRAIHITHEAETPSEQQEDLDLLQSTNWLYSELFISYMQVSYLKLLLFQEGCVVVCITPNRLGVTMLVERHQQTATL